MAKKDRGRSLSESDLYSRFIDDDGEGGFDVETYVLPDGEDIENDILRKSWQGAVKQINEMQESVPPANMESSIAHVFNKFDDPEEAFLLYGAAIDEGLSPAEALEAVKMAAGERPKK